MEKHIYRLISGMITFFIIFLNIAFIEALMVGDENILVGIYITIIFVAIYLLGWAVQFIFNKIESKLNK